MSRILIAEPEGFNPRAVELLRAHAEVVLSPTRGDGIARALDEYDVVWLRLATRISPALVRNAKRCRVIATPVTGLDHIAVDECAARGMRVVSLRGETEFLKTIRATAELTIGLMLSVMRNIPAAHHDVLQGHWNRDAFRGRELYGKSIAIIGAGRLGTLVATYLRAFGAEVVGYDPRVDFPAEAMARASSLTEALRYADIVSMHVALNDTTANFFGADEFAAMKAGSYFVNTSRGGVVDESALLHALRTGHLAGAAVDVVTGEPHVDATHPLVNAARSRANLIVVPHIGGNTVESFEKTELFLAGRVLTALTELGLTQ